MEITNKLLDELSYKLNEAVAKTLKLDTTGKIFVGNEERMFLYALLQKLPSSTHITAKRIENSDDVTNYTFGDIWTFDKDKVDSKNKTKNLGDRLRLLAVSLRGYAIWIKNVFLLRFKLRKKQSLIHYSAHIRYGSFVIPNLSSIFYKSRDKKDIALRNEFSKNLIELKVDQILVDHLANLFPVSHLESYTNLLDHPISNEKVDTVVASIYGVMFDPLVSFIIKNNESRLIYVQHGGGYGLNKQHLGHQMEEAGCDLMYFWGTGDNNVFPTRYRKKYFAPMNRSSMIVLSNQQDEKSIRPYIELARNIFERWASDCVICTHPDSQIFEDKNIRYGTSDREHEKAQLVIYDSTMNSLMYQRILTRRPFLVIDSDINDARVQGEGGRRLLVLMREARLLIPSSEISKDIEFWIQFSPKKAKKVFNMKARLVLEHILDQPTLESKIAL